MVLRFHHQVFARLSRPPAFHIDVKGKPVRPKKWEIDYLIKGVETQIERSANVIPGPAIDEY